MKKLKGPDLGFSPHQRTFDPGLVSTKLADYIYQHEILPYTAEYQEFRRVCLMQLRRFPAGLVGELARLILKDHGLRLLSYELAFYHRSTLPDESV